MKSASLDNVIKSVFDTLPIRNKNMVLKRGSSAESAILQLDSGVFSFASKANFHARRSLGMLTVYSSCNEIAASGAKPVAIQLRLITPKNQSESDVNYVLLQAVKAAEKIGVDTIGISAEISRGVNSMMLACNAYGRCIGNEPISASDAKPGDTLILTKRAALEGSIMICNDHSDKAYPILTHDGVTNILSYSDDIDAVKDGVAAARSGASAMIHVSVGGVLQAVYNMCFASGCGAEITESDIPLLEETKRLCNGLVLDPMRLASSGCMLIATPQEGALLKRLRDNGIQASVIGRVRKLNQDTCIIGADDVKRRILHHRSTELDRLPKTPA